MCAVPESHLSGLPAGIKGMRGRCRSSRSAAQPCKPAGALRGPAPALQCCSPVPRTSIRCEPSVPSHGGGWRAGNRTRHMVAERGGHGGPIKGAGAQFGPIAGAEARFGGSLACRPTLCTATRCARRPQIHVAAQSLP